MSRPSTLDVKKLLTYIYNWSAGDGPLTLDALSARMGFQKTNIHHHLTNLKHQHLVDWARHRPGTLHVTDLGVRRYGLARAAAAPCPEPSGCRLLEGKQAFVSIPIVADIPAGPLGEAPGEGGVSFHPDWVSLPVHDLKQANPVHLFALQVSGDSMRDAGILDGDVVIIQQNTTPERGDIIAASVHGEVTLKQYFPAAGGDVILRPANEAYPDYRFPAGAVRSAGKVIYVLKPSEKPRYCPVEG
jgi:repressor LexA